MMRKRAQLASVLNRRDDKSNEALIRKITLILKWYFTKNRYDNCELFAEFCIKLCRNALRNKHCVCYQNKFIKLAEFC